MRIEWSMQRWQGATAIRRVSSWMYLLAVETRKSWTSTSSVFWDQEVPESAWHVIVAITALSKYAYSFSVHTTIVSVHTLTYKSHWGIWGAWLDTFPANPTFGPPWSVMILRIFERSVDFFPVNNSYIALRCWDRKGRPFFLSLSVLQRK